MRDVTVGIINYNGESVLGETLRSVFAQDSPRIAEVLVVDDGSTDRSAEVVRSYFPQIRFIPLGSNQGPNPARNRALLEAKTPRVLLMDNDIVLTPDVVRLLSEALDRNPQAGIAGAQIRHRDDPERIQYNGVAIHYIGGAVMNRLEKEEPIPVCAASGGTLLVDREKAFRIGLFDEDFYSGWEDGDFTFRMNLAGYPVLQVTRAKVYHKKGTTGLGRAVYQIRNRWWFLLKNYSGRTLLLIAPALWINHLAIGVFMLLKGRFCDYIRGTLAVWVSLPSLWKKRKAVMAIKRRRDRELLSAEPIDLLGDVESRALRLGTSALNGFFVVYWKAIRRWIP